MIGGLALASLFAVGVLLWCTPTVVHAVRSCWRRARAAVEPRTGLLSGPRQDATTVPTPGVLPRQTGRHRRDEAGPGAVSGTDNLRRAHTAALERHQLMLAAAEADRHPGGS